MVLFKKQMVEELGSALLQFGRFAAIGLEKGSP
jgi:hypothetical protein